jgi:hypothetical protein
MDTVSPARQRVGLTGEHAFGIVTGETHLSAGTVADQKILRDSVCALDVGIVTTGAFDVAVDQLHRTGGVGGFALRNQRGHQVGSVLHGQNHAEGMRSAQVGAERIDAGHRSRDRDLAVYRRLSHGYGAVVATQAQAAGRSESRLGAALLDVGGAGVGRVGGLRQGLVPQRSVGSDSAVWSVAEGAAEGALRGDGGSAGWAEVVHAEHVSGDLRGGEALGQDQCAQRSQDYSYVDRSCGDRSCGVSRCGFALHGFALSGFAPPSAFAAAEA